MTHLDLFSGIGGFAIAAQSAGFTTIGFSEIEPYACKILKRHWPEVPNYGDIRNVRNVRCDLITGGFPCQPFSCAGKRRGTEDDRHLWPEMCRVIEDARPAWVLGENVPGIIGMELDRVLDDLERIGYATRSFVIPACAVDARHRRDRVWIVANRNSITGGTRQEPNGQGAKASDRCEDLADSNRCGAVVQGRNGNCNDQKRNETPEIQERKNVLSWLVGADRDWQPATWVSEPKLGRVVDGLPNRAHRLKGLGNAIVPAVAEMLLRMMVECSPHDPRP
jgi:DNA (cytosine-5)-methyltransferase 1